MRPCSPLIADGSTRAVSTRAIYSACSCFGVCSTSGGAISCTHQLTRMPHFQPASGVSMDAFARVVVAGQVQDTRVVASTLSPVFNDQFSFNIFSEDLIKQMVLTVRRFPSLARARPRMLSLRAARVARVANSKSATCTHLPPKALTCQAPGCGAFAPAPKAPKPPRNS